MPHLEFGQSSRPLGPGVLTIGSAPEAGWRILDYDLAPIHAMITFERDGHAQLTRPSSRVKILVNGEELLEPTRTLDFGDEIALGRARLTLREVARQERDTAVGYLRDLHRGRAYAIGDRVEIGRDMACGVHLADPEVSRVHAEVVRRADGFEVRPRTGLTFHNGTRVTDDLPLTEGDELSVGRTVLKFTRETPASAPVVKPVAVGAHVRGDARMSRAQTSYMGTVQLREQLKRAERRRLGRITKIALIAGGAILGAFSLWRGATAAPSRDHGPSSRLTTQRAAGSLR